MLRLVICNKGGSIDRLLLLTKLVDCMGSLDSPGGRDVALLLSGVLSKISSERSRDLLPISSAGWEDLKPANFSSIRFRHVYRVFLAVLASLNWMYCGRAEIGCANRATFAQFTSQRHITLRIIEMADRLNKASHDEAAKLIPVWALCVDHPERASSRLDADRGPGRARRGARGSKGRAPDSDEMEAASASD